MISICIKRFFSANVLSYMNLNYFSSEGCVKNIILFHSMKIAFVAKWIAAYLFFTIKCCKVIIVSQWTTKNWRFEEWFNNILKSNTMKCKKLATIVSGRKKHSTTLRQAKTGKHVCRNITATLSKSKELSCKVTS